MTFEEFLAKDDWTDLDPLIQFIDEELKRIFAEKLKIYHGAEKDVLFNGTAGASDESLELLGITRNRREQNLKGILNIK